jgi:hypothetical protein
MQREASRAMLALYPDANDTIGPSFAVRNSVVAVETGDRLQHPAQFVADERFEVGRREEGGRPL